jgi:hypothetical protein
MVPSMREVTPGLLCLICACGGGGSGASNPPPVASTTNATPTASASVATPRPSASASDDDSYDDPNESASAIVMQPEVTKSTPKSTYPKAKVSDGDCWKSVSFSGQHDKDWTALIDQCGTPTGMVEYVKPANGKLHHIKDAVDSFTVPMTKTQCYRLFAVADQSIHDIDIIILRNGAILGTGSMTQPVEIIQGSAPFCPVDDGTYSFDVKIKGEGKGAYTFGIWTRPK